MILHEGVFEGITKPEDSFFGLCSGQTRSPYEVLVASAGWYNQLGELLGVGDLAIRDFVNIYTGLTEDDLESFVLLPNTKDFSPHRTLTPKVLTERCWYIIDHSGVYVFDQRFIIFEYLFVKYNLPAVSQKRYEAYDLIAKHVLH